MLAGLAPVQIERIADGLGRPGFVGDVDSVIRGMDLGDAASTSADEVRMLLLRMSPSAACEVLAAVATERRAAVTRADRRLELVWTGPERDGTATRDTGVVVRELFRSAETDVLVAGYALYNAHSIFEPLAERMIERPNLRVRLVLNISRGQDRHSETDLLREFARRFRQHHWPAGPLPMVFYDPRAFEPTPELRAVMHAKCVAVDGRRTLVTSANLTEAAQVRNVELGIVVNDSAWCRAVTARFDDLIACGSLQRLNLE